MSIFDLTIAGAAKKLAAKEISAVELTKAYNEAVAALNPRLNAYITTTPELALEQAKAADARIAAGEATALTGIPIAMKDLFCTEGVRTTAASKILEPFIPPYESTVSAKLKAAGAVMLGKANLDEFAMGSSNITSGYGPVENPWKRVSDPDAKLVPGGSSGGSAAAVAARMALAATGTDTGGSIRQPASFSGIAGIKPTYGRCSRWGIVAFASSLDQAGPMARNVEDCAILLNAMAGFDEKDSTSAQREVPDFTQALNRGVKGLSIGIPREYRLEGTNPEILALWDKGIEWLQGAGCRDRRHLPAPHQIRPARSTTSSRRPRHPPTSRAMTACGSASAWTART